MIHMHCAGCLRDVTLPLKESASEARVKALLRRWGWKEKRDYYGRPMNCPRCVRRDRKISLACRGPILGGFTGGSIWGSPKMVPIHGRHL